MKRLLASLAAIAIAALAAYFLLQRGPAPATASAATALPAPAAAPATPAAAAAATAANAMDPGPGGTVEGRDYRLVPHPSPVENPRIVQVEEFFWYGCPHCLRMESLLATWVPALPADAHFVRVPENLGRPEGVIHQRAFYAAQNLGVEARVHLPLMTALVIQHQPLVTPQAIANFVAREAHVTIADFNSQFASFVVDGEVRAASERSFAYGITGVPSVIVGGKYLVDSDLPGIATGGADENARFARMLKVARDLVDKVRTEQAQSGP